MKRIACHLSNEEYQPPLTQYDVHKPMFIAYLHIETFSFFQPKSVIYKKENQAAGVNLTA
ncbi:hypothetical protein SJDPG4_06755 [Porphyromonas gingivalis SJD4]|nr:hypothetical protein SJDPG4_06755 [Porphyromonas gingivalis SJD4]